MPEFRALMLDQLPECCKACCQSKACVTVCMARVHFNAMLVVVSPQQGNISVAAVIWTCVTEMMYKTAEQVFRKTHAATY